MVPQHTRGPSLLLCTGEKERKQVKVINIATYIDIMQLQLGHLADAFIQSDLHRLIHTLMAESTMQGDSQLVRNS